VPYCETVLGLMGQTVSDSTDTDSIATRSLTKGMRDQTANACCRGQTVNRSTAGVWLLTYLPVRQLRLPRNCVYNALPSPSPKRTVCTALGMSDGVNGMFTGLCRATRNEKHDQLECGRAHSQRHPMVQRTGMGGSGEEGGAGRAGVKGVCWVS